MDNTHEEKLRAQQLEVLGRIMASFTHELKNHLAIINESNGLLTDLLDRVKICDENLAVRLDKITTSTQKRLAKAAEMAQYLNGFAHRMDTPLATFAVNELICEELAFLHRFSHLKMVGLETSFAKDLPAIYNNPSLFQFVFFCLFDLALEGAKAQGRIRISSELNGDGCRLVLGVRCEAGPVPCQGEKEIVSEVFEFAIRKMGATFSQEPLSDGWLNFALEVPSLSTASA